MATTDSSSNTHSPQFRRNARNLPSPWSHVVRGEPEAVPAPPSPSSPSAMTIPPPEPSDRSPSKDAVENPAAGPSGSTGPSDGSPPPPSEGADQGNNGNADAAGGLGKKPAWNKLSNGFVEVSPLMGAVSWPPLSESTRASPKSSFSDSLKGLSDGSVSAPPGPVIASPPSKLMANNTNPSSSSNHTRQKSMKRGGGSGGAASSSSSGALANGGPTTPPPLSLPNSEETPQIASDKPTVPESSPRDHPNRSSSNWDHGSRGGGFSQRHGGSDHHRNYGGNRRGNSGGSGGGLHHNSYGNRHDHDRGSYEWNPHRSFSNRDVQMQQQQRAVTRPYLRPPPPGSAPFITAPPPVRPFGNPMGFPDMPSPVIYFPAPPPPESLRSMPFVAPPAMFFPAPDSQLRTLLANQIDYYFSFENLCKDIFLRQNMDDEGWVHISIIANFNRVRRLTNNIQFILDTVRTSTVVELQGDKIRRRNDWMTWPLPSPSNQIATMSSPQLSAVPNYDTLAARVRSVGLDEGGTNGTRGPSRTEIVLGRSSSGELSSQSQVGAPNGEGTAQITAQSGSDRSVSARSLVRSDTF